MSPNPVRTALVSRAELWPWSSAAAHCAETEDRVGLELSAWNRRWSKSSWKEYLQSGERPAEIAAIRRCTHTGRPLGEESFVRSLEDTMQRRLSPQKGGRPKHAAENGVQARLDF